MMLSRMMRLHMQFLLYLRLTSVLVTSWKYIFPSMTKNWNESQIWCEKNYTGLMVIQNKEQHDHLRQEFKRDGKYWIGLRKNGGQWIWPGTGMRMEGNESWAEKEPNNKETDENCVEMYITHNDMKKNGKWNDEPCTSKKEFLCYIAHCIPDPCTYGTCHEIINSYTCIFDPCKTLSVLGDGKVNCSKGNSSFCLVECSPGHLLLGARNRTCQTSGLWRHFQPMCISYDHLLLGSLGFSALSTICYCMFCCSFCKKRKKTVRRTQDALMNPMYEAGNAVLGNPLGSV